MPLLLASASSALLSLALSAAADPATLIKTLLMSPPGLVLIGRTMMAYSMVYPATGSTFLAAFAAIFFNNIMSLAAVLPTPLVIYTLHKSRGTSAGGRFSRFFMKPAGWRLAQKTMATIALLYIGMFTFITVPAALYKGLALFMPFEAAYVTLASATVYTASKEDEAAIEKKYRKLLRKTLPIILILVIIAAAVEAYEAV